VSPHPPRISMIETINKWLKEQGSTPDGSPLYRLVWSEDQREIRYGLFRDYSGPIFVREVVEARRVHKYSYISEKWILEKWFPMPPTRELPAPNGYEPFYVFESKDGQHLNPTLKVVQFIVDMSRNEVKVNPLNGEIEMRNLYDTRAAKDIKEIEDSLECSPITNALHMKEAVGYTKEIK